MKKDSQYSAEETRQRLQATLRGAFSGSPTQLKDIPKENGESRRIGKKKKLRRRNPSTA
jgi:hypothetical protein